MFFCVLVKNIVSSLGKKCQVSFQFLYLFHAVTSSSSLEVVRQEIEVNRSRQLIEIKKSVKINDRHFFQLLCLLQSSNDEFPCYESALGWEERLATARYWVEGVLLSVVGMVGIVGE